MVSQTGSTYIKAFMPENFVLLTSVKGISYPWPICYLKSFSIVFFISFHHAMDGRLSQWIIVIERTWVTN